MEAIETKQYGKMIYSIIDNPRGVVTSSTYGIKPRPYCVDVIQETPKARYWKTKHLARYAFDSIESARKFVQDKIDDHTKWDTIRANSKAERKAKQDAVKASDYYKVGDILYSVWGYDQTNVDFYQVIGIGNKTITVTPVAQQKVEGTEGYYSCNVVARVDAFIEPDNVLQLRVKDGGNLSPIKGRYSVSKWDGRPKYKSWYY